MEQEYRIVLGDYAIKILKRFDFVVERRTTETPVSGATVTVATEKGYLDKADCIRDAVGVVLNDILNSSVPEPLVKHLLEQITGMEVQRWQD